MPRPPLATDLARVCAGCGWLSFLAVAPTVLWGRLWGFGVAPSAAVMPLVACAILFFVVGLVLGVVGKERGTRGASVRLSIGPNVAGLLVFVAVAAVGIGIAMALGD
ncbi:MAG: hypothetical protein ACYC2H_13350 [Thermoplasmatota archaeon]